MKFKPNHILVKLQRRFVRQTTFSLEIPDDNRSPLEPMYYGTVLQVPEKLNDRMSLDCFEGYKFSDITPVVRVGDKVYFYPSANNEANIFPLDVYEEVTGVKLENNFDSDKYVSFEEPLFFGERSAYEEHLAELSKKAMNRKIQEDRLREGKPILLQVSYDEIIAYERYGQMDTVGTHILVTPIAEHQTTESGIWLSTQPNKTLKGVVAYKGEGLKCHKKYNYSEVYESDTIRLHEDIVWLNNNSDWGLEFGEGENKRDYYVCKRQDILAVIDEEITNLDVTTKVEDFIIEKLVMPYMNRCWVEILDGSKDVWEHFGEKYEYSEGSKLYLSSYGVRRRRRCVKVRILASNEHNEYVREGMVCYATHIETTIESDGLQYHFVKEQDILLEIQENNETEA